MSTVTRRWKKKNAKKRYEFRRNATFCVIKDNSVSVSMCIFFRTIILNSIAGLKFWLSNLRAVIRLNLERIKDDTSNYWNMLDYKYQILGQYIIVKIFFTVPIL